MSMVVFFWAMVLLVLVLALAGVPRREAKTAVVAWLVLLAVLGCIG